MASPWEDFDIYNLLASIEFCREKHLDFDQLVLQQLQDARIRHKKSKFVLSDKQVKQKLIDLSRKWAGSQQYQSKATIKTEGISCIPQLPHGIQKVVEVTVEEFRKTYKYNQPEPSGLPNPLTGPGFSVESNKHLPAASFSDAAVAKRRTTQLKAVQSERKIGEDVLMQKDSEIRRMQVEWQLEVQELSEEARRYKRLADKLRGENETLVLARQERERAQGDPLECQSFWKNEEIWRLTCRVKEMIDLQSFINNEPAKERTFERQRVGEHIDRIGQQVDSIVQLCEAIPLSKSPSFAPQSDLSALVRGVSDAVAENGEEATWLRKTMHRLGVKKVVRTLIVAALRMWVFEVSYPNFEPRERGLLQTYREIVYMHGWDKLHNLDHAAYRMLIERLQTSNELTKRGGRLACRFSRALAPLFKATLPEQDFQPWSRNSSASEDLKFCLTEAFEAALELKVYTTTTQNEYELVIHPLEYESEQNASSGYASVFVYSPQRLNPSNNFMEALVKTENFAPKTDAERSARALWSKSLTAVDDTETDMKMGIGKSGIIPGAGAMPNNDLSQVHKASITPATCSSCPKCSKDFIGQELLTIHRNNDKYCQRAAEDDQSITKGLTAHAERGQPFPCKNCERTFEKKISLQNHLRSCKRTIKEPSRSRSISQSDPATVSISNTGAEAEVNFPPRVHDAPDSLGGAVLTSSLPGMQNLKGFKRTRDEEPSTNAQTNHEGSETDHVRKQPRRDSARQRGRDTEFEQTPPPDQAKSTQTTPGLTINSEGHLPERSRVGAHQEDHLEAALDQQNGISTDKQAGAISDGAK